MICIMILDFDFNCAILMFIKGHQSHLNVFIFNCQNESFWLLLITFYLPRAFVLFTYESQLATL